MTSYLLYDIETNGMLDELDRIHCAVLRWSGSEEGYTFLADEVESLHVLEEGTRVAHNAIGFDDPAIAKVTGVTLDPATVRDTLIMSRVAWPDLKDRDLRNLRKNPQPYHLPKRLSNGNLALGSHSLEAWGYRLNEHKGDYTGGWETFSQEMLDYCGQDVVVLEKLWNLLQQADLPERAVLLEQDFARCMNKMMERGVCFDVPEAEKLERSLTIRLAEIDDTLSASVEPFTDIYYTPVKKLKRVKEVPFKASSRAHIARHFQERHGWQPSLRTLPTKTYPKGQVKTDAEVLESLPYPEAPLLVERAQISKILGYVSVGKGSWLNYVKDDGRIYGYVNHMGTVTSRCAHSRPNLGNIPKTGDLGAQCRRLFVPAPGLTMVGADASGLELRCLANRLTAYDGGRYAKILLEGNIHAANQRAAGLKTYAQSKKFIYAWLYGAGAATLGAIVGGGEAEGRAMKRRFLKATPGVREWVEDVKAQAIQDEYVVALDGRRVPIPHGKSKHTESIELLDYVAPNYQLQSDGAVIMKQAAVNSDNLLASRGDAWQVLSVHDEYQFEVEPASADYTGEVLVQAIRDAGEQLDMSVELDGEAKEGKNWNETH